KAGSVAHFQGEVLARNICDFTQGKPLSARFDGHANCFIESGFNKAFLIDFNYDLEPLTGAFPLPFVGPKKKMHSIKVATVGNPAMGIPTLLGALPGMAAMATMMMSKKMGALDIPPIPEFIQTIHDAGGKLYACKASVDMFGLTKDDFCPQVESILTVGEFYGLSAGAQIIFT
ncbi:MAG: DsrE/DsrF/DrsH-like family protein, partial [Chitinivibrionales bacterium]|nr:DsrE/DsrF/DrsH-like family protein [Chitinivibrionales bacterium]